MADQSIIPPEVGDLLTKALTTAITGILIFVGNSIRTWFNSKTEARNEAREDKNVEDAVMAIEKVNAARKKMNITTFTHDEMKSKALDYAKTLLPNSEVGRLSVKIEAALLRLEMGIISETPRGETP